jgi:hypothetical protein
MGKITNNNIKQEITKCVLAGDFLETRKFLDQPSQKDLEDLLFVIGCDEGSLAVYTFVCFLIQEHETIQRPFLLLNY